MSNLHKERKKSGIVVIGIHTPGSKIEDTQKVMKEFDLDYPICIDTTKPPNGRGFGSMSSQYGANAIPYAFVIDQQGNVAGVLAKFSARPTSSAESSLKSIE
jgi:peroxiredoxin